MARFTKQARRVFSLRESYSLCVYADQRNFTVADVLLCVRDNFSGVDAQALEFLLDFMGGRIMARGKGTQVQDKPTSWTKFVDIPMTGVTADDIAAEFGDADAITGGVDRLLSTGYRVGVSYNGQTQSYVVSLTCRDDSSPNSGCTVTSHAGNWWFALAVMCYKHYVVAREDWSDGASKGAAESFG